MAYATESGVYQTTGFNSDTIQEVLQIPASEVTTLVTALIANAQEQVQEDIGHPFVVKEQLILGDGNRNKFMIDGSDDPYSSWQEPDVENNLIKVFRANFGGYRRLIPYPDDCDEFTEYSDPESNDWRSYNAVITGDTSVNGCGSYSIKAVFSDAGYIQFPSSAYFNRLIDQYSDVFFYFRTDDIDITNTFRLYDTDGNYTYQTFTPRVNGVGQYFWLDIDEFTDSGGSINWDSDYFQYFRLYVSGSCTVYFDNFCFADDWAFSNPEGYFHVSRADNISTEKAPSESYPFKIDYSYDPFLSSTPSHIELATEWLTGVMILDELRNRKYDLTDFRVWADTMEQDIPQQGSGLLAVRTYMMRQYERCLTNYGGRTWGVIM
jgi:hypothetical protein